MNILQLIEAHRQAHTAFNLECPKSDSGSEEYDPSDEARQRYDETNEAEETTLQELCRYPAITDDERKAKADYLLEFAKRNEFYENHQIDLLEAEFEASQAVPPLDLSGLKIDELDSLHSDISVIIDHLEAVWQLKPCCEKSKYHDFAVDLTPVGKRISDLQQWFNVQLNRIPGEMATRAPKSARDIEIHNGMIIKNAVDHGATMQEIADLAMSLAAAKEQGL